MAENAPRINPANQGTLRKSIAVADITTVNKSWTCATIGGVAWSMEARRRSDGAGVQKMAVYLRCATVVNDADVEVIASFVNRLRGVDPIEKRVKSKLFEEYGSSWGCRGLLPWSDVLDPTRGFVVDGQITIEIDVTVEEVNGIMPAIDMMGGRGVDLDDASFADMRVKVKGEDWEGILCHKAVMCRHSEAINAAMTTASSTEANSGVFEIGDPFATTGGVEQFVRLNYEEWKEETMDKHAVELFVLGEVLLCRRVKVLAKLAIKRLLSVDTFWATLKAAVRIDDKYIIKQCVRFAGESLESQAMVINNEDGKEITEGKDKEGVAAFLVLMKEIGEMNDD